MVNRRQRWTLVAGAAAITGAGLATGLTTSSGHAIGAPQVFTARLVSSSSPAVCSTASFCIQGGPTTGSIFPGGATQTLPLTFFNPYNVPLKVVSLQVVFAGIPAGCDATAFQINTTRASGSPPSVTFTPMIDPTTPLVVPQAGSSGSGHISFGGAQLGLKNLSTNQDACQGVPFNLTYNAQATFVTSSCISGSQNGLTVSSGQVACITKTGKVTNGINVQSGGILLVNGGSVTGGIKAISAAGINLCGASVSGGIKISSSTGEVVFGDGQGCAGNSITNGMTVSGNTAGIQVISNSITGGFTANNNTGSIPTGTIQAPGQSGQYVQANTGSGGMSCSGNSPALADGGFANTISGARSSVQCPVGF